MIGFKAPTRAATVRCQSGSVDTVAWPQLLCGVHAAAAMPARRCEVRCCLSRVPRWVCCAVLCAGFTAPAARVSRTRGRCRITPYSPDMMGAVLLVAVATRRRSCVHRTITAPLTTPEALGICAPGKARTDSGYRWPIMRTGRQMVPLDTTCPHCVCPAYRGSGRIQAASNGPRAPGIHRGRGPHPCGL